ncbi:MAG: hypothetical protein ACU836_18230 [Gammaproteobacteria bacterium]
MIISTSSFAMVPLPAGKDQIRLITSDPKKNGETLFSYTVTWRIEDGLTYRASGLTFMHGPDKASYTQGAEVSKKLAIALTDAMEYLYPSWRGAKVEQTKDKQGVIVSNKQGFDFTQLTFRDYSNMEITYDLLGKAFNSENVATAIDVVFAADVENLADLNLKGPKVAAGGNITVKLDGVEKANVKTDGKSMSEIEKDLAKALGSIGNFSEIPIFPNLKDETTRNYKPFDGGEVQIPTLSAKSITIDVNDPSLGVLTKFEFPDVNKPVDIANNIVYIIAGIVSLIFGFFAYPTIMEKIKQKKAAE